MRQVRSLARILCLSTLPLVVGTVSAQSLIQIDRRSLEVALEWARRNRETLENEGARLNER